MSRSVKESSSLSYQTKGKCFRDCCHREGTDPTIPLILRFLEYLFDTRRKRYNTVLTYRAALHKPMHSGLLYKDNMHIHDLLAHYCLNPHLESEASSPNWNLNVAFHYLKGPAFEPLGKASLRDLTRKTLF